MTEMKQFPLKRLICILSLFLFLLPIGRVQGEAPQPIILQAKNREIVVNGKKAQMYEIAQVNGTQGLLSLRKGEQFNVIVENKLDVPTGIHWHGLILPNDQDGVPYVTQPPIPPGGRYPYNFPLVQAGTFWMHAHYGLQEQQLLAAPLILHHPTENADDRQEVVMFLSDFTFQNPLEIFKELKNKGMKKMGSAKNDGKKMKMAQDLNDVTYDAFLTNWRTLSDPEIVKVQSGKEVLLRVINGSSSTNFFINLRSLTGEAVAIDGSDVEPLSSAQFNLAVGQRIDINVKIPLGEGFYPILAKGEGLKMQTGLVLATDGAAVSPIPETDEQAAGAITYAQEFLLEAKSPLAKKKIDRRLMVNLEGDMSKYIWLINGKAWPDNDPLFVKEGERVEIYFVNRTAMSHPMHLHGHVFQVTNINGIHVDGPLRDTVLVLPHSAVRIQFDAVHPGIWPFHCHNLYHQYAGMMTTLNYEGFKGPVFSKKEKEQEFETFKSDQRHKQ